MIACTRSINGVLAFTIKVKKHGQMYYLTAKDMERQDIPEQENKINVTDLYVTQYF